MTEVGWGGVSKRGTNLRMGGGTKEKEEDETWRALKARTVCWKKLRKKKE